MNIPYEIHITVEPKNKSVELFKQDCLTCGVKPILLDLHTKQNNLIMKDLMTSSVVHANSVDSIINEATKLSELLKTLGYSVLRLKIEAPPWHPLAPTKNNKIVLNNNQNYFESHLNIMCDNSNKELLTIIAKNHKAHRSTNAFKVYENNFTMMITLRDKENYLEIFQENLNKLKTEIMLNGFLLEKEIVEFCIFDSNENHDSVWTK
ncbi:MAG: hypothetical protein AABY22_25040 [Nanoarchaeota archaeon]